MPRKKKKGGVAFGFILTVGILSLLTVVLLYEQGPSISTVEIPATLPKYGGFIAQYAPQDALQVSFDNLTAIRAVNQSVISDEQLFELDIPHVIIDTTQAEARLTIGLSTPNATVTVVTLEPAVFQNLSATMTAASAAGDFPTERAGNLTVYAAAGTLSGEQQAYWMTLVPGDRSLVYSIGATDALTAVKHVVSVRQGGFLPITNNSEVDRMLFAVNGTSGHLALGIQQFAGSVTTGNATVISVDSTPSAMHISYAVRFAGPTYAASQVGAVKSAYISAHQFVQYDEIVKAIETQPISQLRVGIGLVG